MRLTPKELDKLMLHYAGALAKSRKERGIKLNYVESIALISMEIMELAREGNKSVAELMQQGREILKADEVMEGVASMVNEVQVEVSFPDGTKLVTIHNPIEDNGKLTPGEYILKDEDITLNANKESISIKVTHKGDRPIQVGSHFHFFEVNALLEFDRAQAFGKRLDIASGTSVRFEPGEEKNVNLIDFGGKQKIIGFNDLTNAHINKENKEQCLANAAQKHFIH
ncbi:urease subunit alpha [Helicobacter hepaticus]|jgi:urease subunit gamma/beta|uniref:Urease subunit alpha n=1 Tax=Helicobacter hepaticus (strain ATCC 51449 / 3B1) TaxID=235279 RepID=URE23_HELHP|nr:urease subunit alpha [Helicobacter hepaticus]Q93PJ5.1 RecName: Full=Urease subunit alpha; AltName: Full=Urea amidohydrolase subunit alpha [Helicobacter hepaticus ATCC 51449]AAK69198.1 urease alpha subunit UreA [Helicobacter hepaticus]AAP77004.1 urease [Helicobacter hepaticus ATCC 51449]